MDRRSNNPEAISEWEHVSWVTNPVVVSSPVFPPFRREGSELAPPSNEPNSPSSSSSSSSPSTTSEEEIDENRSRPASDFRLAAVREIGRRLTAEVVRLASKVQSYKLRGGFWSVAGVVTAILISVLYARLLPRWRRRAIRYDKDKEQLLQILREKDERISQLLLQIVQMNEALSARRRVPVLRVG